MTSAEVTSQKGAPLTEKGARKGANIAPFSEKGARKGARFRPVSPTFTPHFRILAEKCTQNGKSLHPLHPFQSIPMEGRESLFSNSIGKGEKGEKGARMGAKRTRKRTKTNYQEVKNAYKTKTRINNRIAQLRQELSGKPPRVIADDIIHDGVITGTVGAFQQSTWDQRISKLIEISDLLKESQRLEEITPLNGEQLQLLQL